MSEWIVNVKCGKTKREYRVRAATWRGARKQGVTLAEGEFGAERFEVVSVNPVM